MVSADRPSGPPPYKRNGTKRAMSGKNQMSTTVSSMQATNGQTPAATSPMSLRATAWMTKRLSPTGGVISAHSIISTKTMPNQIGSMPSTASDGSNTGIMIKSIESASRKQPISRRTKQTTTMNGAAVSKVAAIAAEMSCGMR